MAKNIIFAGDPMTKQPQELLKQFLTPLANKVDTDIVLCVCHGKRDAIPQELDFDKMYVYVQMLPNEFDGTKKAQVKGCKIDGEAIAYGIKEDAPQPCPQGDSLTYSKAPANAVLIKDDDGQVLAAVQDGGIYIANDCIHSRDKKEFEIAQKVLGHIINKALEQGALLRYLKGGVEVKAKKCLEDVLKSSYVTRLEKERVQLKAAKDTIEQYIKSIVDGERKIISTERIIEAIQRNISDIPTALDKTWSSLMRMKDGPQYTSVSFSLSGIKAITSPIVIVHNKIEYDMGRYEVNLKFSGECVIKCLDRREKTGNYDHPHITDGRVCWGNFSGYIPKLIGSSEFDVALVQIYTFLCHYDAGSPYRTIDNWPVKKKETKAEAKLEVVS